MISLSMIPWMISAPTPQELSSKMFDLNWLNQKNYQFTSPIFDSNLGEYVSWYNVDVLTDKPLDGLKYQITDQSIKDFMQAIKDKTDSTKLKIVGGKQ
jgi:hypothetical protein